MVLNLVALSCSQFETHLHYLIFFSHQLREAARAAKHRRRMHVRWCWTVNRLLQLETFITR